MGPHAAPVGHQSLRPPCPEPSAWSKGPRNARTRGQSEQSGCAHVPGSRAWHGSEEGRIRWDREGTTFPAIPNIPARGDGGSIPRLDRDTGSKARMWGKGPGCGEQCHAALDLGRGRELRGAGPSGWYPSGQALLQLEAGIAGARHAAHPRCSWKREKEKGGDPATSPRQSWPASSSRDTPCPGHWRGTGTHRQPGRAAPPT